ncbi:hypothetical protein [Agrobacterium tumefaciens]|nr:hypothetical protein [Agrobacterium tumefaciens]NSZ39786.1 hypothetical protein [Agrobacterium tumefaciens]NTB26744.1 hypothetical protein [Agrobacterium tumefaciens]NTB31862.1 hypothetical protein [Agrobacterium tumefaciens]NTB45991.1 hypothetical protein [Agrobacterium tumefaciens]NTB71250.1 hypothetical protein [Agrobacterium tumefaciens]
MRQSVFLLAIICVTFSPCRAWAQDDCGRKQLANKVKDAQQLFEKDCGFTIMQGRLPGDVNCGHGQETIGEAWDRALVAAGVPKTFDERESLAKELDLNSQASLVLMGMARAEGIDYLLRQLRTCEP